MKFELTVLGSGSALPRLDRKPSAHLLNVQEHYFLIDCGEGTQLELKRYGVKFQRIHHIFITHLHGDHYLGLMGLLSTLHLLGREEELHIHGPEALEDIISHQMDRTGTTLRFQLRFHPVPKGRDELLFENEALEIRAFPLYHRSVCNGFRFDEKPKLRKIRKEKLQEYDIPVQERPKLKEGKDVLDRNGKTVRCEELTDPPPPSHSYAYCSDTAYFGELPQYVQDVDLLFHDATFLEDLRERARETFHSTALDAARTAKEGKVGRLLLGHFSARYRDLGAFREEAAQLFPAAILAQDGMRIRVDRPDREPTLLKEKEG